MAIYACGEHVIICTFKETTGASAGTGSHNESGRNTLCSACSNAGRKDREMRLSSGGEDLEANA